LLTEFLFATQYFLDGGRLFFDVGLLILFVRCLNLGRTISFGFDCEMLFIEFKKFNKLGEEGNDSRGGVFDLGNMEKMGQNLSDCLLKILV
jgi:hypothetical protein